MSDEASLVFLLTVGGLFAAAAGAFVARRRSA
jgi:LPXTG-motif cell wall-anchored protein